MNDMLYEWKRNDKEELSQLLQCNVMTQKYGLSFTEEQVQEIMVCRNESLKKHRRVEFGSGVLQKVIYTFCDSSYINQWDYVSAITLLQDIFYKFKNESLDQLSDDELLTFMHQQFEEICMGDFEYLESTCLERFAKAIREGYEGFIRSEANNEYEPLSEEQRWDSELYMDIIKGTFWG